MELITDEKFEFDHPELEDFLNLRFVAEVVSFESSSNEGQFGEV